MSARWLWHHGQHLLLLSAIMFFLIMGLRHWVGGTVPVAVEWAMIAGTAAAAAYIGRSEYISDLFNEFPAATGGATAPAGEDAS